MGNATLEVLFPRFCVGCGFVGSYLCGPCELTMRRTEKDHCYYCGKPSLFGLTHPRCLRGNGLNGYLSVYLYDGLFKRILHESKYMGAYMILRTLLSFPQPQTIQKLRAWQSLFSPKIISVPLHQRRMRERGFNQSDMIARAYLGADCARVNPIINRATYTPHLAMIKSRGKRNQNIRGAFVYVGKEVPRAALVIDDVVTTGSTMLECVGVLKRQGVQTVLAFSLAKG